MTVAVTADERLMRIGEVARGAGVSVRAVRYYEQQGLLIAERSPAGQRLYRQDAVSKVRFFQQMFAAGLTSQRIVELLPCWDSGHTDAEQRAMLRAERERLQARIDELQVALGHLDEVIAITDTHP
ncbi:MULTISPECIES: MerR family transcriptional regulator [unclassified Streptomyces]|uniref:MerR family transcriptional regulator n=1 Tax=Streptomyces TaxID=1883 RepID=UPI00136E2E3B|nr:MULTISPECIES: MerR family transcriptional regulator [unclassified Streptomyces]NEA04889.1 MerR family transcriptional regulator [Streptomyces sp. SID10116]MYY87543.1 MerR family transcriptional regulator [Streptomyces sp. SID335]MYZ13350.1 MerR family transcriptional regulator [Streptomyces sp. SID337]NDZ91462.1 MerR family transcriptional regulator [Streptomyces sp. SID10115]NEB49754.1 MerR family transcriptional regulator [Streptomyces sp. SID339]